MPDLIKKLVFLLSFDVTTIGYCYCDGQMCEFIGLFTDAECKMFNL